jgi:hypothetical protein
MQGDGLTESYLQKAIYKELFVQIVIISGLAY